MALMKATEFFLGEKMREARSPLRGRRYSLTRGVDSGAEKSRRRTTESVVMVKTAPERL